MSPEYVFVAWNADLFELRLYKGVVISFVEVGMNNEGIGLTFHRGLWAKVGETWYAVHPSSVDLEFFNQHAVEWRFVTAKVADTLVNSLAAMQEGPKQIEVSVVDDAGN